MNDTIEPLLFDLVQWIAKQERSYVDVMDAWRTSCPRLPVWEEANARGLVRRNRSTDGEAVVAVTTAGLEFLDRHAH